MITLGLSSVILTGAVLSAGAVLSSTAAVLLGAWFIRRVGRLFVVRTVDSRVVQYRWGKTLAYLTLALAIVFIIAIWVDGLSQVGTFLGLVSAGVAIALKDVLVDVAGWLVLITKPPFEVGDRIQIGPHSGDVVDTSILHFHLLEIGNWVDSDQSTGRVIRIPNSKILTDPIMNYTAEPDVDFVRDGDGHSVYIGAGPRDLLVYAFSNGSEATQAVPPGALGRCAGLDLQRA